MLKLYVKLKSFIAKRVKRHFYFVSYVHNDYKYNLYSRYQFCH